MQVTPEKLRQAAANAEVRSDWDTLELLNAAADRIIALEAQNQAYRHALSAGVTINMIAKKRWFKKP